MLGAMAAVAAVWAILVGAAYFARAVLGLRRGASLLLLVGCYVALAGVALAVIGWSGQGLLGAGGMLLPLAVACALVVLRPGR